MGYVGNTLSIAFNTNHKFGGFSDNPNREELPPHMLVDASKNVTLHEGGYRKRGGTIPVGTQISGSPQIIGYYDFVQLDGTQFEITAATDGKVYKNDVDTIAINLSTTNYHDFATIGDTLLSVDGSKSMRYWVGTGSSAPVTNPPSDWAIDNSFPQQVVIHGRGLAQRAWTWTKKNKIFGCKKTSGTTSSDPLEWRTTDGGFALKFESRLGDGLTAIYEFGDRLFLFTNRNTYLLEDSSTTEAEWGIEQAPYVGGAAHWRLISIVDNDLFCMMDDGNVYSVKRAQFTGDYKSASITKPFFLDRYIKDNIDLTQIEKFHMGFDPVERTLKIWMVRKLQTKADLCFPYYPELKKWGTPYINTNGDSGFKASVNTLVKVGTGDYRLRTGDYSGRRWDLNLDSKWDNETVNYRAQIQLPEVFGNSTRAEKNFKRVIIKGIPTTTDDITLNWSIDGVVQTPITAKMLPEGILIGSGQAIAGQFYVGGNGLAIATIPLGVNGKN